MFNKLHFNTITIYMLLMLNITNGKRKISRKTRNKLNKFHKHQDSQWHYKWVWFYMNTSHLSMSDSYNESKWNIDKERVTAIYEWEKDIPKKAQGNSLLHSCWFIRMNSFSGVNAAFGKKISSLYACILIKCFWSFFGTPTTYTYEISIK